MWNKADASAQPFSSIATKEFVAICNENGINGNLIDLGTRRPHVCYSGTFDGHRGEWEVSYRPDLWDSEIQMYLPPWKVVVSHGNLPGYNAVWNQTSLEDCITKLLAGVESGKPAMSAA